MATISIVTPSLNKSDFIADCINSVHDQSDFILEHLIMDGVSTDGTIEIIKAHTYEKLLLKVESDKSQSDALNKLFHIAKGDYICWLNSDDMLAPDALRKFAKFVESQQYDVIYGDWLTVGETGNTEAFNTPGFFRHQYLKRIGCYIPSSGTFFRKSFLQDNDVSLDINLRYVMDYDLFLNLSEKGAKFGYLNEILSMFRMYEGNLTSSVEKRRRERRLVQYRYGMHTQENVLGVLNMWLQYYSFKFFYLVENKIRKA